MGRTNTELDATVMFKFLTIYDGSFSPSLCYTPWVLVGEFTNTGCLLLRCATWDLKKYETLQVIMCSKHINTAITGRSLILVSLVNFYCFFLLFLWLLHFKDQHICCFFFISHFKPFVNKRWFNKIGCHEGPSTLCQGLAFYAVMKAQRFYIVQNCKAQLTWWVKPYPRNSSAFPTSSRRQNRITGKIRSTQEEISWIS